MSRVCSEATFDLAKVRASQTATRARWRSQASLVRQKATSCQQRCLVDLYWAPCSPGSSEVSDQNQYVDCLPPTASARQGRRQFSLYLLLLSPSLLFVLQNA